MSNKDSTSRTIIVALVLCLVCSLVVAGAAVMLKPLQVANKELDEKRNILAAAGLLEQGVSIEQQFEKVTVKVVDIKTGKFTDAIAVDTFKQLQSAKDPSMSIKLTSAEDVAKISRREDYSLVYLIEKGGSIDKIILPIRGYGLWSTLYGFIALDGDADTVAGLGFYQHGETPGLGGEVDNPRWKASWPGKKVYDHDRVALGLIKGRVNPDSKNAQYEIDGLAGATLTSRGITNLVHFWLGDMGFEPFLNNLRNGEAG